MTDEKFIKKASKDLKRIYSNKSSDDTPVFLPGKSHGQRSLAGYIGHN